MDPIRRVLGSMVLGVGVLAAAGPALAVDPGAYLADMPNPDKVTAAFTGADTLDTAAVRFAAFSRLEDLTKKMIGDRGPAGKAKQSEADLLAGYTNQRVAITKAVKDSLPEDQRGFFAGTRFTAWAQQIDRYQADPKFNKDFRNLFSASFQRTYAEMLADREREDAAPLILPFESAPLTGTAYVISVLTDNAIFLGALAVYLVLFVLVGPSGPKAKKKVASTGAVS